jgi:urease accessory protein
MLPADLTVRPFAGLADLIFAPRDGRTRLVRSQTRPPLTVGRVLYPDEALPDLAHLILANPTAGVFAGDRLAIRVRVRAGSRAHLTTQAATRLHPMPGGAATQRINLVVEPGAALEWLPDATIPFWGARFSQTTMLTVAPGGTLIYAEMLTPGRVAMGESLAYTRLRSRLTVQTPERCPLYREVYSILPGHRSPLGRGLLGTEAATLGTLLMVTDAISTATLREALREGLPEDVNGAVQWGVAELPGGGGVCVKALGEETQQVGHLLRTAWGVARQQLWGVGLPPTRKY